MPSPNLVEHFVTLFDSLFLPMGMALHESLMTHAQPFHLWIVCMDEKVEADLRRIDLPHVTVLPLRSVENDKLQTVKPGRNRGEYCWTMTPFTFQAVFDRDDTVERVTYLDADLFFFASPQILLDAFAASGKHVLITDHAYAPEYANKFEPESGRFCVQFMTFVRSHEALEVMRWWQEKCLEWCFAIPDQGRFGDQKYLDCWPELFAEQVYIVPQTEKTLAPWNVQYREKIQHGRLEPVFYHFHGLRIIRPDKVRLYQGYPVGKNGLKLYTVYLKALSRSVTTLNAHLISIPFCRENASFGSILWRAMHAMVGKYRCRFLKS